MRSTPFAPCRIATALLLVFVSMILIFQSQLTTALKHMRHGTCGRGETPHEAQYHPRTFPEVTPLEDLGARGDEAWQRLTTERGGFLWLRYNETFNIPYGISMFHGLHCLQMLRGEFQMQLGLSNGGGHHHRRAIATDHDDNRGSGADIVHLGHCLAYVAEMLQCVGDGTIEEPWIKVDETTGQLREHGVDGAGMQHQCRDTSRLWAIAEETENEPAHMWNHKAGDTVELVFGEL